MAKKKDMINKINSLETQLAEAKAAESESEVAEPEAKVAESEVKATEPVPSLTPKPGETANEIRKRAVEARLYMNQRVEDLNEQIGRFNAGIEALEARANKFEEEAKAKAKAKAEAKAKKEVEVKAQIEAEAKVKKEAAAEKAKKDAEAKAKADLLASINKADKPRVGKAYKWWDYDTATWNITADVWKANQLSDKWEVVYVWYRNGEIERLLNKEELEKYCPH